MKANTFIASAIKRSFFVNLRSFVIFYNDGSNVAMRFLRLGKSEKLLNRALTRLDCEWSPHARLQIFYVAASLGFEPRRRAVAR